MAPAKGSSVKRLLAPRSHSDITIHTSVLEPTIFVNTPLSAPSVLRGHIVLDISKEVQIRHVTIRFRGVIRTSKFGGRTDEEPIVDQTWPVLGTGPRGPHGNNFSTHQRPVETRRLSSISLGPGIRPERGSTSAKERATLSPGRYVYDFELTLDQTLPESFNVGGCQLIYHLQAVVHRPGILKRDVSQSHEVAVLRCPDEMYLHDIEHISLARMWNKQIPYQIDLCGKGAPIGSDIPVCITVSCQKILSISVQVYLGQKIRYPGVKGKDSQLRRKLLLKARCNDLSTRKFGDIATAGDALPYLNLDQQGKTVIIETNVPLPNEQSRFLAVHPDVEYKTLQATHSLLFIIDVATPLKESSSRIPTVCRLTGETMFCLRSPHTRLYNMFVPQYSAEDLPSEETLLSLSQPSDPSGPFSEYDTAPSLHARHSLVQSIDTSFFSSTRPQSFPPPLYQRMEPRFSLPPPPSYESIPWNGDQVQEAAVEVSF
ncbi:hypothetical protein PISL3812_07988 [Talaromyces islandicus]|uniref:Arrestin-like N-terminal domain-containing protein n=1 Tax=Talaromyces islandicus TaxID=28573 RepID=A0A0U1M7I8_TALIS|nr:hypothetical protein PISL3812_07988 [Talaromyces islandicus]